MHPLRLRPQRETREGLCTSWGLSPLLASKHPETAAYEGETEEKKKEVVPCPLQRLQQGVHCQDEENHEDKSGWAQTSCKKGQREKWDCSACSHHQPQHWVGGSSCPHGFWKRRTLEHSRFARNLTQWILTVDSTSPQHGTPFSTATPNHCLHPPNSYSCLIIIVHLIINECLFNCYFNFLIITCYDITTAVLIKQLASL